MNVTSLGLSWNSRYLELEPTELAIAVVAALLVGGAALYVLLKVLRSKPVKLLGMGLLIGMLAAAFIALVDHTARYTRTWSFWIRALLVERAACAHRVFVATPIAPLSVSPNRKLAYGNPSVAPPKFAPIVEGCDVWFVEKLNTPTAGPNTTDG